MTHNMLVAGVHDGFYAALFHRTASSHVCLFDEIVGVLKQVGSDEEAAERLPLYLTGHSLGGAIASVFAQALQAKVGSRNVGYINLLNQNKNITVIYMLSSEGRN